MVWRMGMPPLKASKQRVGVGVGGGLQRQRVA